MVVKEKELQLTPPAKILTGKYMYGTGRRKTAIARVRLYEKGTGQIIWNGTEVSVPNDLYLAPLELVGEAGKWNISTKVVGGGKQSQLEATRLGVARALIEVNGEFRQALKKAGFLTRDPREKERNKPGLKGARRAPQWAKR